MDDWLDPKFMKSNNFPGFKNAIETIHGVGDYVGIEYTSNARRRLIFDEFFAHSISLNLRKFDRKKQKRNCKRHIRKSFKVTYR